MGAENIRESDFQLVLDMELATSAAQVRDDKGYELLNKVCYQPKKSELNADSEYKFMIGKDAKDPEPFKGMVNYNNIDIKTKTIRMIDWGGEGLMIGRKLKTGHLQKLVDKDIGNLTTAQINKPVQFFWKMLYYANATSMTLNGVAFDLTTYEGSSAELIETSHSIWDLTCVNEVAITVGTTALPTLAETRAAVDYLIGGVRRFTDTSGIDYPYANLDYDDFVFCSDTYMASRLKDLRMQQGTPERGYQNFIGLDSVSSDHLREASHDRLYAIRKNSNIPAFIWLKAQESPEMKVHFDETQKVWLITPTFDWMLATGDPRAIIMGRKA